MRAWCEYALGIKSRDALERFLRSGPVQIERHEYDVYGRTLAYLTVTGRDAGEWPLSLQLARRYLR